MCMMAHCCGFLGHLNKSEPSLTLLVGFYCCDSQNVTKMQASQQTFTFENKMVMMRMVTRSYY